MALLLCALFESIKLDWKLVISGRSRITNDKVRHIEGGYLPPQVLWSHIYCMVGTPPFKPTKWYYCEPTLQGVPLGWDVVSGSAAALPEMGGTGLSGPELGNGGAGAAAGAAVATALEESGGKRVNWKNVGMAVMTGVVTSVTAQVIMELWREKRALRRRQLGLVK